MSGLRRIDLLADAFSRESTVQWEELLSSLTHSDTGSNRDRAALTIMEPLFVRLKRIPRYRRK